MKQVLIHFFVKHRLYLLFQALAVVILAHFTIFHEAGLNDGDSITHYLISRYAWHYPHLFLDNWGKPFFILLSSPFAQFGYRGIQVFNIGCAILSGWFCYRVAAKIGMDLAFLAPVFLFMTPVYFTAIPSGLTEILFGLVLIASICLLIYEKPIWAAILISFLPFCRSEGVLLLPVIGLYLLWTKRFAGIPFLFTGFLVYSTIGYFYLHDFLWEVHTNPYHTRDIYGHGTLLHFLNWHTPIFGDLLGILFVIATLFYAVKGYLFIKNRYESPFQFRFEWMVLWLTVMVYFTAHSIFWYKGLFASAGLWRVMAAIAPPFAIVCMRGMTYGLDLLKNKQWGQWILNLLISLLNVLWTLAELIVRKAIWLIVIFIIIYQPIHYFRMPQRLSHDKIAINDACNWVKENKLQTRKIYYSEPFTKICLSLDPYDLDKSEELMYVWHGDKFSEDMPTGSIIIWEPNLGPREDGIPLSKLEDTTRFNLLKIFEAANYGDKKADYQVYIFERR